MRGTAGAVIMPHMVPQALSSRHVWYRRRCRHAAHGVAGVVVMPCVVSQVLSSCHAWCRGCCRRTAWSHGHSGHAVCGVTVAIVVACDVVVAVPVVVPHVVSRSHHTTCGVTVTIVVPRGATRVW